jgi:hypothetical protein
VAAFKQGQCKAQSVAAVSRLALHNGVRVVERTRSTAKASGMQAPARVPSLTYLRRRAGHDDPGADLFGSHILPTLTRAATSLPSP